MQAMLAGETFQAWDWWHLAENRVFSATNLMRIKQNRISNWKCSGAFAMAEKLFGLSFEEVDVEGWNPVVSFDVKDKEGKHLGYLVTDMYARDSKRGVRGEQL